MYYSIGRFLCAVVFKIFLKVEVVGGDVFPKKSAPFILASNHLSNLDPPLVGVIAPYRLQFLAKEELFKNKFFGGILRLIGCIPLKRGRTDIGAIKTALKVLKERPLVIFPQGSRSDSFENFSEGVGFLCKKSRVPVIVAKIYGTEKAMPKGSRMIKKCKVKVIFDRVDNITDKDDYDEIAAKVVDKIKSL